eukprot:7281817-Prymnesium_polylepis.1
MLTLKWRAGNTHLVAVSRVGLSRRLRPASASSGSRPPEIRAPTTASARSRAASRHSTDDS